MKKTKIGRMDLNNDPTVYKKLTSNIILIDMGRLK